MRSLTEAFIFISVLCWYLPLYAGEMLVYAAGTGSANGIYHDMGIHPTDSDGVHYYQKDDLLLYRVTSQEEEVTAWIIGPVLGGLYADENYYGVISNNDTPEGLTMTMTYGLGETPYPSINLSSDTAPDYLSRCINVTNAGTESVNGYYLDIGDFDGVNYYKKGDLFLYRITSQDEGVTGWIIGPVLGSLYADENYYGVISNNDTPEGLTMTMTYTLGDLPYPSLGNCAIILTGPLLNLLAD